MKIKALLCLLALSCLSLTQAAFSAEKVFPNLNCSITIPDDWVEVTANMQFPGMVAAYTKPDQTGVIFLTATPQQARAEVLDDKFIANFEAGITESGGTTLVKGKIVEAAGLKCYERIGALEKNGKKLSSKTLAIPTNEYFYSVNSIAFNGLVTDDSELEKAFSSFRFQIPPKAPAGYSSGYKIGYFIGQHFFEILASFVVAAILVVALIVFLLKKKKSQRRSRSHSGPY